MAENENYKDVCNFNKACQNYNMKVAEVKTKSITISRKLVINDRIIEQIMQIDYLGTRLTSNSRADEEM